MGLPIGARCSISLKLVVLELSIRDEDWPGLRRSRVRERSRQARVEEWSANTIPAEPRHIRAAYDHKCNKQHPPFIFLDAHGPGAGSKSATAAPPWTSPSACASLLTFTSQRRSASELFFWTICRCTRRARSTTPLPREALRVRRRLEFNYVPSTPAS